MTVYDCGTWYATCSENVVVGTPVGPTQSTCVCPSTFMESFDRSQLTTDVYIGRTAPSNIPPLLYSFTASTSPPGAGQLTLSSADQETASTMYVAKLQGGGADVTSWLRFLNQNSTITISAANDKKTSRSYRVTNAPVERTTYFELGGLVWTDGRDDVPHGFVEFTFSRSLEAPMRRLDTFGIDHYGDESFQRTDLINSTTDLFGTFADRIIQIRGSASVPRVESVTIDARRGGLRTAGLMSTCQPGKPSRYKVRLKIDNRFIYDRMCFATAVRHHITDDEWTAEITLDVAEWAAQL